MRQALNAPLDGFRWSTVVLALTCMGVWRIPFFLAVLRPFREPDAVLASFRGVPFFLYHYWLSLIDLTHCYRDPFGEYHGWFPDMDGAPVLGVSLIAAHFGMCAYALMRRLAVRLPVRWPVPDACIFWGVFLLMSLQGILMVAAWLAGPPGAEDYLAAYRHAWPLEVPECLLRAAK